MNWMVKVSKTKKSRTDRRKIGSFDNANEEKVYLPDLTYFFELVKRNFLLACFFQYFQ